MLYSIGKDSRGDAAPGAARPSIPAKPPFPLLHVDTTWKFREMIRVPRPDGASELGHRADRPHQPGRRAARASTRSTHGSALHTDVMKTEALKQALDQYGFDAAFGGARRDEEKRRAKERIFSLPLGRAPLGPQEPAARAVAALQRPQAARARASASSRCPTGPSSTSGNTSTPENIPIVPLYFADAAPGGRARRHADHGRRRPHAAAARRDAADEDRSASAPSAAIR